MQSNKHPQSARIYMISFKLHFLRPLFFFLLSFYSGRENSDPEWLPTTDLNTRNPQKQVLFQVWPPHGSHACSTTSCHFWVFPRRTKTRALTLPLQRFTPDDAFPFTTLSVNWDVPISEYINKGSCNQLPNSRSIGQAFNYCSFTATY